MSPEITIPEEIKALIFDCDGTLVDSMPMHMEAWRQAFAQVGASCDSALLFSFKGMKETDVIASYNRHYHTNLDPEEMVKRKHKFLSEKIRDVRPINITVRLVKQYYRKLPLAVVSGSPEKIVHPELTAIGILDLFEIILTADDPFKPKPAPDIFLEAAKRLEVEPQYCQVFEDGDPGLESARTAGMLATDIRLYLADEELS